MSTLEEMKQQLKYMQNELKRTIPPAHSSWTFAILDIENAIWTLQQRIKEAEDREAIYEEVYPLNTKEQGQDD